VPSLLDDDVRDCLNGGIPLTFATCAVDGTPNVTYASHAHLVDARHIALSYQFFSKSRENILGNPRAAVALISPRSGSRYHLDLEYSHTESSGPIFESMKARLAGIASHSGMAGVFRLRGSDVYRVLNIERVHDGMGRPPTALCNRLRAVRAIAERMTHSESLVALFPQVLEDLDAHLGVRHAMLLVLDAPGRRLYTVASRGYPHSGVGSEIALGCGVIGVAAEQRTPIRISHLTSEYTYSRAVRESAERAGLGSQIETAIPFPGLADSRSQLAVPVTAGGELLGALYVESPEDLRFTHEDEDALVTVAAHVGLAALALRDQDGAAPLPAREPAASVREPGALVNEPAASAPAPAAATTASVLARHFPVDDSIFLNEDYLIKGVAGAIFAKLLREYTETGRTDFTNRELRLDPALKLPDLSDNLEARLVLLQRRLLERSPHVQIERTGRGRFRLKVGCRLSLVPAPASI
jgi:GAF domain/Pyridoxamine 5'-phosphate oxidase